MEERQPRQVVDRPALVTVALIDDQPIFVEGFRALCKRTANVNLVATSSVAAEAGQIVCEHDPTLLFMDVATMENSFPVIGTLLRTSPQVRLIVLTGARSIALAIRALDAGVHGYILKQSSGAELIAAIDAIRRGEKFISQGFAHEIVASLQDRAIREKTARAIKLNIRENQIVRLLISGKTNKEIALALSVSEKTVKHCMTGLMQKLSVRNRLEAAAAALELLAIKPLQITHARPHRE